MPQKGENLPMTIVINLPEATIKITEEELNFNRLEQKIWEHQMRQGQAILEKALEKIDEHLADSRGDGLKNKGLRQKYLSCLFGDIQYCRRAYYDEQGKFRFLLDEKIGLDGNQRVSVARGKLEAELASMKSYRKAEDVFWLLLGGSRSFEAIRQGVFKVGREMQEEQEEEAEAIFEGKVADEDLGEREFAVLEADGTMIHLQGERQKKAEVKLGVGYDGWEPRYKKGRKRKGFSLAHKFIYMGIEEGERFSEKLSLFAKKYLGLDKVKHLLVGGDGATWITENLLGCFVNATYQLCRFHLNRAIKTALGHNKVLQRIIKHGLRRNAIDEVLKFLQREARRVPDKRTKIKDLMVYIENNRQGINGIRKLRKKLSKKEREKLRGTGAIEGNIDKAVANRLKKRGMRWSIAGANCLLKITEKILNGKWDKWWVRKKEIAEDIAVTVPVVRKYRSLQGKANQEVWTEYLEREVPVLHGSHQDRRWVKKLREKIYFAKN